MPAALSNRCRLLLLACCAAPMGWAAEVDSHLAGMSLSLTEAQPYRFVLAYHGPVVPFRGSVCYHFAGYNETCLTPKLRWLTPATELALYAPGGVPRDLLPGYTLLVRFPALSPRTFQYRLPVGD